MESYYEVQFDDGTTEKLDGVVNQADAKSVVGTVKKLTGKSARLFRVREIELG